MKHGSLHKLLQTYQEYVQIKFINNINYLKYRMSQSVAGNFESRRGYVQWMFCSLKSIHTSLIKSLAFASPFSFSSCQVLVWTPHLLTSSAKVLFSLWIHNWTEGKKEAWDRPKDRQEQRWIKPDQVKRKWDLEKIKRQEA